MFSPGNVFVAGKVKVSKGKIGECQRGAHPPFVSIDPVR